MTLVHVHLHTQVGQSQQEPSAPPQQPLPVSASTEAYSGTDRPVLPVILPCAKTCHAHPRPVHPIASTADCAHFRVLCASFKCSYPCSHPHIVRPWPEQLIVHSFTLFVSLASTSDCALVHAHAHGMRS